MKKIASLSNPNIKLIQKLHITNRRHKEGLFLIEGLRLAEMAENAPEWSIQFAILTDKMLASNRCKKLASNLSAKNIPLYLVMDSLFNKLSEQQSPQGIILVARQKKYLLSTVYPPTKALYIVVDRVQDPGNLGSIIRSVEALGASGIILLKGTTDLYSEKVIRSTMGAVFNIPIYCDVSENELLRFVCDNNIELIATVLDNASIKIYELDFSHSVAIILGNEGNGISHNLQSKAKKSYIPMLGNAESLNVASVASIVAYEANRQRQLSEKQI